MKVMLLLYYPPSIITLSCLLILSHALNYAQCIYVRGTDPSKFSRFRQIVKKRYGMVELRPLFISRSFSDPESFFS
ncbi:hypothetical protein [Providencia rettgeri]|uniref:hypothetical protein n=1 Tax=Providencia rettgeri TaxID=587 RepID=UPI00235F8171|nr:hypothetical protein [Providencia rettgeri]